MAGFSKDWQTIEQRERKAAKARKTQRRGQTAAAVGALTAGGAYATGSNGNLGDYARNTAVREAKDLHTGAKYLRSSGVGFKNGAKLAGGALARAPLGAALVGGTALAGLGGAGMLQGAAREGYQQNRINARRKSNQKRYGNGSGVGKRYDSPVEEDVAKRDRKVSHGQRVKTFNGRTATINRKDLTSWERAQAYIGQGLNVAMGTQGGVVKVPYRNADARGASVWHRTGIRGTSTDDKYATKLRLKDRSNTARNVQSIAQGVVGGGVSGGVAYGLLQAKGKRGAIFGSVTAAGLGGVGASRGPFRPADRRLEFSRPVAKGQILVRDMRADKNKSGVVLRQSNGVRQYLARGADGKHAWKDVPSSSTLSKRVRNKDVESDRQRRLGMAQAGLGAASVGLGYKGVKHIGRLTRSIQRAPLNTQGYVRADDLDNFAEFFAGRGPGGAMKYPKSAVVVDRKGAALAGGAAATGAGALGAGAYARSRRNRRWE